MQRGGKTARGRYYGADVGSTTSQRRPTPLAPRTPSPLKMRDYAHRHRDPFFTKLAAEFHQAGHLDIGNKHHARVFVVEGREPLEDGLHEMLGHGGDDHDQHVILVEHEMAFVEAVTNAWCSPSRMISSFLRGMKLRFFIISGTPPDMPFQSRRRGNGGANPHRHKFSLLSPLVRFFFLVFCCCVLGSCLV